MIIGLTGCPGSGKSFLASEFEKHGWIVVDADKIGREIVENDQEILGKLAHVFGSDIIGPDGRLQRRVLAKRAFSGPEQTRKLNQIVHPLLILKIKEHVLALRSSGRDAVVDCALIFEWGIGNIFDKVVCVAADEDIRRKRLIRRDGRTSLEIDDLFAAQLSEEEKIRRADIVVQNNGSDDSLPDFGGILTHIHK
ncbi:dephospho-CoA kinase [bacterium]|nr:dephospho-CoA kinase [bacterium]